MPQRKKQRFSPLVASSLAIALGVSVASATTGFYQQNNGAQGSEISSFNGTSTLFKDISINGINYTAFELDGSVKDEFKLFVLSGSNAWKSGNFGGKGQLDVQANSMLVSDQGLAIGNSGTGTLTLDLWTNNNNVQSFILDLSTVNSSSYAFLGNLNITGSLDGTAENYSHKTLTTKFGGKGIKGNLNITTKANTNLNFTNGANIDGNITINGAKTTINGLTTLNGNINATGGTNNIIFNSSANTSIEGQISARNGANLVVTLGNATTINGDILAQTISYNYGASNRIVANGQLTLGTLSIKAGGDGWDSTTNTLDIAGSLSLSGNVSIVADRYTRWSTQDTQQNIIKLNGNIQGSGKIVEISSKNDTLDVGTNSKSLNVISLDAQSNGGTLNVGAINKSSTIIVGSTTYRTGYTYIGKDITTKNSNGDISLNNSLFTGNNEWQNQEHQAKVALNIEGDIYINSAANYINVISLQANNISSSGGRISGDPVGKNHLIANTMTINGDITTSNGANILTIKENGTNAIKGNIYAIASGGTSGSNIISTGSITLGQNGNFSIKSGTSGFGSTKNLLEFLGDVTLANNITEINAYRDSGGGNYGYNDTHQNILKFNGSVNGNKTIQTLTARNEFGQTEASYNILSFENGNANQITIDNINSTAGTGNLAYNYIGKGFTVGGGSELSLNSEVFTNGTWANTNHQANIQLTVNSEIQTSSGNNYINVKQIKVNGNILATRGNNHIVAGSGTINGEIIANGGTNAIVFRTSGAINQDIAANSYQDREGKNVIITDASSSLTFGNTILTGSTSGWGNTSGLFDIKGTINLDDAKIIAQRTTNFASQDAHKNIFSFGSTVSGTIGELTAGRNYQGSSAERISNTLSFEGSTNSSITITSINKQDTVNAKGGSQGNNYIGKGYTTGNGESLALDSNVVFNTSANGSNANNWNHIDHQANLELTVTNAIDTNSGASLYINVKDINIEGDMAASGGNNNIALSSSGNIAGSITRSGSGQNNFTLNADSASLTLKGANNSITTLTAKDNATNGNTLNLDATNNNSVNATIATLTNGGVLKVNFAGINANKSTKLTLDTTTASNRSLKSVSVESGTNNTLVVAGADTMTIGSASIGETSGDVLKGAIFDLSSGSNLTFTSGLTTNTQGIVTFNLGGTSNTITGALANSGENNFNFVNNANLAIADTLTTNTNAITNFNLIGINTLSGTLTNNGVNNFNIASSGATLQNNLTFSSGENNINFQAGASTLNWKNSDGTALKNISTTGGVTNFNLIDSANATITAGSQITTSGGTTNINFGEGTTLTIDSIVNSEDTGANTSGTTVLNFNGNGTLASGISTSAGTTTINIADGKSGEIQGNIGNSGSGATNIFFASGNTASQLTLNKASGTYEISSLNTAGTNKTLSIAQGTTTISESVNVSANTDITFALADSTTLILSKGMSSVGTSTISVASSGSANSAILSGGAIKVSNVSLSGDNASTLTLTATSTDITTLSASATTSNTLILNGTNNAVTATINAIKGESLAIQLNGADASKKATLTLNGGVINSVSATNGDATQNIINFNSGTTTITEAIDSQKVANTKGLTLNLNGGNLILSSNIDTITNSGGEIKMIINNATLSLNGNANKISSLSGNGVVDLAMADSEGNPITRAVKARSGFKTLTLDGKYSGNSTFNLYVNPKQSNGQPKADKVVFGNDSTGTATITVTGNIDDIMAIKRSDNVIVAQTTSGGTSPSFIGGTSLVGYDVIQATLTQEGDTVYLEQAVAKGVAPEIKEVASSALTVNYDLFLANFNSLNKRMGELRDNPHSNGVWARVFGGNMSNDFGAGSKTEYVTAQGGYDYSLTLGDAKNYIGVALAYGHSTTKSNALDIQASQGSIQLQDVKSNMVEVGVYNSYVADNGWYNDTIFKFDYIMSSFTMTDNLSLESKTNNFAMILSDEFGYRYKFAENEKGNWYIDPQVEVAFGYFNQSDFNRAMVATNSTLEATQDNILTLRTRAGLSLGKKFNTSKGFASLYVGAFYEYDYIEGGNAEVLSKSGIANPLDKLESNGRAMLNVGSNIGLTESARLYIDVEKSFGDKQRTFMQFNLGARYSF